MEEWSHKGDWSWFDSRYRDKSSSRINGYYTPLVRVRLQFDSGLLLKRINGGMGDTPA